MEYKRFDDYDSYGPHMGTRKIPGKTGFELKAHSACVEGWFRAKVHVEGSGPADPQNPQGIPFDVEDTGWPKFITAEQCAEGG